MNKALKSKFRIFLAIVFYFSSYPLFAQNYEKEFETLFAWEVKQVDEFIERFNNMDNTLIRQYSKKVDPLKELDREKLIKSLFNAENKNWDFNDVSNFINQVNNETEPVLLNFYDNDWYAKVDCSVRWKGKAEKATLILKIDGRDNGSSKWVITGVQANFLQPAMSSAKIQIPASQDTTISLNPMSHATDFMNLDLVTKDKQNIANYFKPSAGNNQLLAVFMNECLQNRLVIDKANSISYHFLQVDGWAFEIQQFNRQTKNSGWLINKLLKVTPEDKELYRAQVLKQ